MKSQLKFRYILPLSLLLVSVIAPHAFGLERATGSGMVKERLSETKLRLCRVKENVIKNRTDNLNKMASNMLDKFAANAKKVEDFYTNKVVAKGKTVANYDSLVADIGTKRGAVDTAIAKAKADREGFSCDGESPKEKLTQFRQDMQAVKAALKDYRTSIKNLLVAVHSVVGTSEKNSSPKPTSSGN